MDRYKENKEDVAEFPRGMEAECGRKVSASTPPWLRVPAYIIGILSTGDTYRLALKGILPLSPSVLTDYRFSYTAPTKHHSGLAARQSVPLKLACFVLLL